MGDSPAQRDAHTVEAAADALARPPRAPESLSSSRQRPAAASPVALTALRLSVWSIAGAFANARNLARVEGNVAAVRDDVSAGFALLEALRNSLADALAAARDVTQRLDVVEGSQAEMQATLAECTAQLRRSRASLSQLDTRLQALLSARIRSDALVDAAALYVALGLLRGLPLDSVAWLFARTVVGRAGSRAGGGRLLALVLRGTLLVMALRALRAAALRAGLHSGLGGPSSYAAEAARWVAAQPLPAWLAWFVAPLVTRLSAPSTPLRPPAAPARSVGAAAADYAVASPPPDSPPDATSWSPVVRLTPSPASPLLRPAESDGSVGSALPLPDSRPKARATWATPPAAAQAAPYAMSDPSGRTS